MPKWGKEWRQRPQQKPTYTVGIYHFSGAFVGCVGFCVSYCGHCGTADRPSNVQNRASFRFCALVVYFIDFFDGIQKRTKIRRKKGIVGCLWAEVCPTGKIRHQATTP